MKGKLELIGDWWYVRYTTYDGGGSFRLLVHPNFVDMTDFVIIKNKRFYDGDEVEFTQVLVNPMGREVDPNDLGKNLSKCKWYAKPSLVLTEEDIFNQKDIDAVTDYINKEEQKQHLIDIMESDEELGLYDESSPGYNHQVRLVNDLAKKIKLEQESREIKFEDVFNDEKREGVKRVIHQHKVLQGLSLVNPAHLQMTDNGHGEFPDGYKLTEKGIQYIIEQLNKEQDGK
jgi:hypothetical protein